MNNFFGARAVTAPLAGAAATAAFTSFYLLNHILNSDKCVTLYNI